jgi:hypothetical protein
MLTAPFWSCSPSYLLEFLYRLEETVIVNRIMVRYKVKADRANENQQYVERVFEELRRDGPPGLRYASFKQSDGVSFVHLVSIETESGENPLSQSPAFQAFQAGIRERCEEQPIVTDLEEVGSYHFFNN